MVYRSLALCSFVCAVGVIFDLYNRSHSHDDRLEPIRASLLALETENRVTNSPRVAVGYGACHDVFVQATSFLDPGKLKGQPRHYDDISSEDELLRNFAYYYRHGAAAERFMSNMELFDELVSRAEKLESRWSLGGNAPLMAKRFFIEGWVVLLAARMSKTLKDYIPKGIEIAEEEQTGKDDIHMILEYKASEKWGPYTAPRANRYILHNDENNPLVTSFEKFNDRLSTYEPQLLVISGLQMMDNFPFKEGVREGRLNLIRNQMLSQPATSLVHFEMASYVELQLLQQLTDSIIPQADSVGMNEQELTNLFNILHYGNVSIVSDSNPRVATALDQMRDVFILIRQKSLATQSRTLLTRMHVHTLAYQAILTVKDSKWKRTKAAAAKASLTAHRYVCDTDSIDLEKTKLVLDGSFATSADSDNKRIFVEPVEAVPCWNEMLDVSEVEICVAPVLVCTEAQLTAGAGDNISAAGLVLQVQ